MKTTPMKKAATLLLALVLLAVGMAVPVSAAQSGGLTFSLKTAVYTISGDSFVRWTSELASPDECGTDEYITLCVEITNHKSADVTLQRPGVSIDGGSEAYWQSFTVEAGQTVRAHVSRANMASLTPGLHTASITDSGREIYSGRFSTGRDWPDLFRFPTQGQIAARAADERSPYMSTWLSVGNDVTYDAYSVDFKSDYLPGGTYSAVFNGYLDLSGLEKQYASVESGLSGLFYGGLQTQNENEPSNSILSFWDITCTDQSGNVTVIRPERIYPAEKTDDDSFGNEGTGAHTLIPYEWQAGRWYRMLLRCGTNEKTGNTTVEQWFMDLTTGEWTHTCTYDTGVRDSGFKGNVAVFSENFLKEYAGEVRSLEVANVRIHTDAGWRDVVSTLYGGIDLQTDGVHTNAYGSWQAGADGHSFYMITTGVPGWGRVGGTGDLTIRNRESGDPLAGDELKETLHFSDVAPDAYCAAPVAWAVDKGITDGTSKTTFSPDSTCTQAQILTFLWRAMGSPRPVGAVSGGEYYASAVQWAKERGIIDGAFSADAPCTRAMAVTYLWKLAGSPSASDSGFSDVTSGASYARAVDWAVSAGVTNGTSATTFSPDATCTRGQIVTFLFRAMG